MAICGMRTLRSLYKKNAWLARGDSISWFDRVKPLAQLWYDDELWVYYYLHLDTGHRSSVNSRLTQQTMIYEWILSYLILFKRTGPIARVDAIRSNLLLLPLSR